MSLVPMALKIVERKKEKKQERVCVSVRKQDNGES